MLSLFKTAIVIFIVSGFCLRSEVAIALTYEQAVKAYRTENYKKAIEIAAKVAKVSTDTEQARAYVIAGAAYIEIGRKSQAKQYFSRAFKSDQEALLPSFVRNKDAKRLFSKVKKTLSADSGPTSFSELTTYLPFGVNQVLQDKIFLGSTVGVIQVAGIFSFFKNLSDANQEVASLDKVAQRAASTGDQNSPTFLDYEKESLKFIKQSQTSAFLSLAGTLLVYGASVYEAGYFPPDAATKNKRSELPGVLPLARWDAIDLSFGWEFGELINDHYSVVFHKSF